MDFIADYWQQIIAGVISGLLLSFIVWITKRNFVKYFKKNRKVLKVTYTDYGSFDVPFDSKEDLKGIIEIFKRDQIRIDNDRSVVLTRIISESRNDHE